MMEIFLNPPLFREWFVPNCFVASTSSDRIDNGTKFGGDKLSHDNEIEVSEDSAISYMNAWST